MKNKEFSLILIITIILLTKCSFLFISLSPRYIAEQPNIILNSGFSAKIFSPATPVEFLLKKS